MEKFTKSVVANLSGLRAGWMMWDWFVGSVVHGINLWAWSGMWHWALSPMRARWHHFPGPVHWPIVAHKAMSSDHLENGWQGSGGSINCHCSLAAKFLDLGGSPIIQITWLYRLEVEHHSTKQALKMSGSDSYIWVRNILWRAIAKKPRV